MNNTATPWIKSCAGGTYFRYVDGTKQVRFPGVGNVTELVIAEGK